MSINTRACDAIGNDGVHGVDGVSPLSAMLSLYQNPVVIHEPEPEQQTPEPACQSDGDDPVPFDCEADNRVPDDILFACHMHKDSKPAILCGPYKDWKLPDVPRLLIRLYHTDSEEAAVMFIENGWPFYMDAMDPQSAIFPRESKPPPSPPPGKPAAVIDPKTTTVEEFQETCHRIFEQTSGGISFDQSKWQKLTPEEAKNPPKAKQQI